MLTAGFTILEGPGHKTRNPIVVRQASGFSGLIGYVGTETIGDRTTREWLEALSDSMPGARLSDFAHALADALTNEWKHHDLQTALWTFISGVSDGAVRFWHVNNTTGMYDDWSYKKPAQYFPAVDDLDVNYIPNDLAPGQTKEELLKERLYSFRNGAALIPAARVFDGFTEIIGMVYNHGVPGFEPVQTLDDLAFFAKQRMEFTKRIFSPSHGIYKNSAAPLDGTVHVLSVARDGEIRSYGKDRAQITIVRPPPC